jgi:hypothetical protein
MASYLSRGKPVLPGFKRNEWLETDGLGGYASGTFSSICKRGVVAGF